MTGAGDISPEERPLHVLNRLAFGPRPGDLDRVRQIGAEAYIQEQLYPNSQVPVPHELAGKVAAYETLRMSPLDLYRRFQEPVMEMRRQNRGADKSVLKNALKQERIKQRIVMREAAEARLLRAIEGPRQLQEVMTAFWFNHFNIFAGKGLDNIWTGSFEETAIRPHTMGSFRALLGATAKHPAMLFYLDNWQNTAPGSEGAKGRFEGINENYARELMELHTLGVGGGYTQADVITLAHILTGWGFTRENPNRRMEAGGFGRFRYGFRRRNMFAPPPPTPDLFYFDASRHDFSSKIFLGRTIEGGGLAEGEHALDILASHPSTARHLSFQLAQFFVADNPPPALVDRMSTRYLATGGDIREVLATMFSSPEFWDPGCYRAKFKSPYQYVISCVRATGIQVRNYRPLYGTMQLLGHRLYGCQTPNGYSNTRDAWLNPDGMMMRLSFATALASGSLPLERPPFEEDGAEPAVVSRSGGGAARVNFDSPDRVDALSHGGPAMDEAAKSAPADADALAHTLGHSFGDNTARAIAAAPERLRAAMILGSPEFMTR